jgi:hypothetical protein
MEINVSMHHGSHISPVNYYGLDCTFHYSSGEKLDSAKCVLSGDKREIKDRTVNSAYRKSSFERTFRKIMIMRPDSLVRGDTVKVDGSSLIKTGYTILKLRKGGETRIFYNPGSSYLYEDQLAARIKDLILELEKSIYQKPPPRVITQEIISE